MSCRYINKNLLSAYLFVLTLAVYPIAITTALAQSETPPHPSNQPDQRSFWNDIDTRFGGRSKVTGQVFRADNDTIFKPVGTGTYWDGNLDFRLTNETFFTETVFTDVAYQLIGAAGDLIRKTNELEELFPNLPENVSLSARNTRPVTLKRPPKRVSISFQEDF